MIATLANVGPMFGGVLAVIQHWPTLPPPFTTMGQCENSQFGGVLTVIQHGPTLPPPFTTLGQTLANVEIANVGLEKTQCLATFLEKQVCKSL